MIVKTDIPGLSKTPEGAIINTDNAALEVYKKKKEQHKKIIQLEEKFGQISDEVKEIKNMLALLVDKIK